MTSDLLSVYREQIGDQAVVHAIGEVDLATAPLLEQALSKATATPTTRWVVVNLTKVDFFGAVGLTVLLTATRHGYATGVAVVVVTQPGQPAHRTITITDLHRKLALIDSDHALDATKDQSTMSLPSLRRCRQCGQTASPSGAHGCSSRPPKTA